jgi:hypothetical protein
LVFYLTATQLTAQVAPGNITDVKEKADLFFKKYPQEKVYLHLDRPSYWANEDIWFKAYLANSPQKENNLYVELVNSSGDIVSKKMYWAENGLAYGDFQLPDTIVSGVYQIRAYTNWMRNFDDGLFFMKNMVIWNLSERGQSEEAPTALRRSDIDFGFFPEGGTFVANVPNRIGFKAVNKYGKGLPVRGKILDADGNEVTEFESLHNGMGNFSLLPNSNAKYTARVNVDDKVSFDIDLPKVANRGVVLAVDNSQKEKLTIQVASSDEAAEKYWLIGQCSGTVFFNSPITLSNGTALIRIMKNQLPNGILQLTLFDQAIQPLAERVVFIKHNDFIPIQIETGKERFSTREKVDLSVKAHGKNGEPYYANLSMAVSNTDTHLPLEKYPNTIFTHFLLTTELKGYVEEPSFYFKDDSLSTLQALDNLLLTQGWRQFTWEAILANRAPKIDYEPEGSIAIRGIVEKKISSKPLPNAQVTLMFVKKEKSLDQKLTLENLKDKFAAYEQKTDSLGRFCFSDFFFNDTSYVSLQVLSPDGKRNTWFQFDKRSSISPYSNFLPPNYLFKKGQSIKTTTFLSEENNDQIQRKWHLSDTILLGDINVRAMRIDPGDGHVRVYADADFVVDMNKIDAELGSIGDYIVDGRITGVYGDSMDKITIRGNQGSPAFLLDGTPCDVDFIEGLPIGIFDKIEVLKFAPSLGSKGVNGAIFFYTKRGFQQNEVWDAKGMRSSMVIGYSKIRQFYSPKYDTKSVMKNDYRSTLYWNPVVRTDSTGTAAVSYYNSDQTGQVEIIVEGITAEGKLCRGTAYYKVEN